MTTTSARTYDVGTRGLIRTMTGVVGLVFVLDLRSGVTLNPVGVLWGLGAALCLCAYFILSESSGAEGALRCRRTVWSSTTSTDFTDARSPARLDSL